MLGMDAGHKAAANASAESSLSVQSVAVSDLLRRLADPDKIDLSTLLNIWLVHDPDEWCGNSDVFSIRQCRCWRAI